MQKINSTMELQEAIRQLESKKVDQGRLLKEQFSLTRESLIYSSVIKSNFGEVVTSPLLISNIIGGILGLSAGYFSKRLFIGSSGNQLKRLVGNLIQAGVTSLVVKKPEFIQSIGRQILQRISQKRKLAS